jgi:transposase InsO family protein
LGIELEFTSKPPSAAGFVPVKRRWVTERSFGTFNFFRRLDKDHEKTPKRAISNAQVRRAVFEFIESWFNRQRRHSALGSLTPCQYEKLFMQ